MCCLERVTCGGAAEPWRNHGREIFLRAFWAIVAGFPAGDVMIKERGIPRCPTIGRPRFLRSSDARARSRRAGGQERRGGQRAIVHGAHPGARDDARCIRHRRRFTLPGLVFLFFFLLCVSSVFLASLLPPARRSGLYRFAQRLAISGRPLSGSIRPGSRARTDRRASRNRAE